MTGGIHQAMPLMRAVAKVSLLDRVYSFFLTDYSTGGKFYWLSELSVQRYPACKPTTTGNKRGPLQNRTGVLKQKQQYWEVARLKTQLEFICQRRRASRAHWLERHHRPHVLICVRNGKVEWDVALHQSDDAHMLREAQQRQQISFSYFHRARCYSITKWERLITTILTQPRSSVD